MGIKGNESSNSLPNQSYVRGADKLMEMELRLLDLIDFDLYVSIQEFNKTQNIFNEKIKIQKENHERDTATDSLNGEIIPKYLRNQRAFKSFGDLTVSKEVSKI